MTRSRLSYSIAIWLSIAFHLGLILLWATYEGFIFVKPKEKNPDIIEAYIEQPIAKNNSDLNALSLIHI